MKYGNIIGMFLICLLASSIAATKLSRHRRSSTKIQNLMYQFLLPIVEELGGQASKIEGCLSPEYKSAAAAPPQKLQDGQNQAAQETPALLKIVNIVGGVLDTACKVKSTIIAYFSVKAKKFYKRVYAQGKMRKFHWDFMKFISDTWDTVTGVAKVANVAIKITADVAKILNVFFKPIMDILDKVKTKIVLLLKDHPLIAEVYKFLTCFMAVSLSIEGFQKKITNLTNLVANINKPNGWVFFLVNLICSWEKLRDGILALSESFNATDDQIKYNRAGRFFGKILGVMGSIAFK